MSRVRGVGRLEGRLVDWSVGRPAGVPRLPVQLLDRDQKAAGLQRVQGRRAMDAAYEAALVLGLGPGTPGARARGWAPDTELPGVSEFFTAELSVLLDCGRGTASHLARRAWTYRESLPRTWAALRAGEIDERRARELADVLQSTAPAVARAVEARLLGEATGLSPPTPTATAPARSPGHQHPPTPTGPPTPNAAG